MAAHLRLVLVPIVLALAALAVLFAIEESAQADTLDYTYTNGNTPYTGKWGNAVPPGPDTRPAVHGRSQCEHSTSGVFTTKSTSCYQPYGPGDFGLDFYGPDNQMLQFRRWSNDSPSYQVWEISPAC